MTVAEAVQAIETDRFSALTNLASNVKTFLRIAAAQPESQALCAILAHDPEAASQLSTHALALAAAPADPDREHPADAALAVYLWLLGDHLPEFGSVAAAIKRDDGRFFWACKLVERGLPQTGLLNPDGTPATSAKNGTATADSRAWRSES